MKRRTLLNSKRQKILLNAMEEAVCQDIQATLSNSARYNALGYELDITTLTTVIKQVTEQKFYEIPPAQYLPIKVGNGAWSSNLVTYTSFSLGDDFETGIINTGANNSRLEEVDAGVDSILVKIYNWAKENSWSLADLNLASKSGNWDLISAKEKARKKNWDLGIQKVAFLGSLYDSNIKGLLTQADVTSDLTTITKLISSMSASEFNTFVKLIVQAYRANNNYTAYPTHFVIPEADYNGLADFPDASYPLKSKLQLLKEAFEMITMKKDFKILPLAYANEDNTYNVSIIGGFNRYCLLNYDEESLRMDIPVPYTATLANSINNFQFQNVGYGQFTGAKAYRPKEMLYFDWQT